MTGDDLVEVYRGPGGDLFAQVLQTRLAEEGIESTVRNEASGVGPTFIPDRNAWFQIHVLRRDEQQARSVINEAFEDAHPELGADRDLEADAPGASVVLLRLGGALLLFAFVALIVQGSLALAVVGVGCAVVGLWLVALSRRP